MNDYIMCLRLAFRKLKREREMRNCISQINNEGKKANKNTVQKKQFWGEGGGETKTLKNV